MAEKTENVAKNPLMNFAARWGNDDFQRYSKSDLVPLGLPSEFQDFLIDVGLPVWAAPNIHFYSELAVGHDGLLPIGEDRYDNKLVLDPSNDFSVSALQLDRGAQFPVAPRFTVFLEQLLAYRLMVENALNEAGEDVFVCNQIPEPHIAAFCAEISRLDPFALTTEHFWWKEVQRLRSHIVD